MMASQAQKTWNHAFAPPSGGGPGSRIERVVRREVTLSSAAEVLDLALDNDALRLGDSTMSGAAAPGALLVCVTFSICFVCMMG